MELYSKGNNFELYNGNMQDLLNIIKPNSIDSIITDPPYELGFMGKSWDNSGIAFQVDTWRKCYSVLKPGAYLLAFGGSRTFHRIACAIEDAGFEIRDTIMWLYGSGFPKSMNIGLAIDKKNGVESEIIGYTSQQDIRSGNYTGVCTNKKEYSRVDWPIKKAQNEWDGWGTALKPAYEPVIVARKPCEGSCVDNVLKYGTGGINIDGCRVGDDLIKGGTTHEGRYPSNVILTYDDSDFDEVCGGLPDTQDESAARYFYCAKASKRDRDEGLEKFETKQCTGGGGGIGDYLNDVNSCSGKFGSEKAPHKNTHPTVKPTYLMQYLVSLVTPPNGTVLDPFNGSGSTGKAVMYENKDRNSGYKYIGIEITAEYLPIADARIRYAAGDNTPVKLTDLPTEGQISIFDIIS